MAHVDAATEPVRRRKRPKKLPRHAYDRRKRLGRRITALVELFRERLGPAEVAADPVLAAQVERAARLTAIAEEVSARALRGRLGGDAERGRAHVADRRPGGAQAGPRRPPQEDRRPVAQRAA